MITAKKQRICSVCKKFLNGHIVHGGVLSKGKNKGFFDTEEGVPFNLDEEGAITSRTTWFCNECYEEVLHGSA